MSQRAAETARQNAECSGHVVDPVARQKFEANPASTPLSDSLSDTEAPPNTLVTYRNGSKEYVSEDVLSGKVLGLLFGANGPICYGFVRAFTKVYKAVKKEDTDPFEVVYVSADTSRREFNRFVKSMPWLAVPFRDNSTVFQRFGVPMDARILSCWGDYGCWLNFCWGHFYGL